MQVTKFPLPRALVAGTLLLALSLGGSLTQLQERAASMPTPVLAPTPTPFPVNRPIPEVLEPGTLAIVIRLDPLPGALNGTRPGDRVDVLGYFPPESPTGQGLTRVLLTNQLVLGLGTTPETSAITVGVTSPEALLLQQAEQLKARPFLVLRAARSIDLDDVAMRSAMTDDDARAWLTGRRDDQDGSG